MVHVEDHESILKVHFPDQCAVYGLIAKIRDLGLSLLVVEISELKVCGGHVSKILLVIAMKEAISE